MPWQFKRGIDEGKLRRMACKPVHDHRTTAEVYVDTCKRDNVKTNDPYNLVVRDRQVHCGLAENPPLHTGERQANASGLEPLHNPGCRLNARNGGVTADKARGHLGRYVHIG
jgi:hypothetical protein